jgi:hypothetical protein
VLALKERAALAQKQSDNFCSVWERVFAWLNDRKTAQTARQDRSNCSNRSAKPVKPLELLRKTARIACCTGADAG